MWVALQHGNGISPAEYFSIILEVNTELKIGLVLFNVVAFWLQMNFINVVFYQVNRS